MKALKLAAAGQVTESIIPSFKKIDSFLQEWNIEKMEQRELFLAISAVLKDNRRCGKLPSSCLHQFCLSLLSFA